MRKCHLCGKLIRRRAEFCRYCTVRQPGAAPDAIPSVAGGPPQVVAAAPSPPDQPSRDAARPPVDTALLEAAMQPRDRAAHDVPPSLDAPEPARHEVDAPAVYDVRPPAVPRTELPASFVATTPDPPGEPPPARTRGAVDADRDVEPVVEVDRSEGEQLVLLEVAPNVPATEERPAAAERPVDHDQGNGNTTSNGHNNLSVRNTHERNGHGRDGHEPNGHERNGHARNGDAHHGDGAAQPAGTPDSWSRDALVGFEHFPEAPPRRKIRWG